MKRPSSLSLALALLLLGLAGVSWSAVSDNLFSVVPSSDSTYAQLQQLEKAGLLGRGSSEAPLTRYEVADLILTAEKRYKDIVVAQADMDVPPPPDDSSATSPSSSTAAPAPAPPVVTVPSADNGSAAPPALPSASTVPPVPQPTPDDSAELAKAAETLHSLDEAYQYELKEVKDKLSGVQDHLAAVDADQYKLWRSLEAHENPSLSVHGLGRAFGISQQYFGDPGSDIYSTPGSRKISGYLDLQPEAVVSKEISWNGIIRFNSQFDPTLANDQIYFRTITAELKPSFMVATVGDFYEAYTPLTLWNRDNLDLRYMPEMWARMDDTAKYESFLNQEPNWPFRGLRMGTELMWPDSRVLEDFKVSVFTDMIRNGFNDYNKNSLYFGPNLYTDWIFAGTASLKSKKWYAGNTSVQLSVDAYGVILDEPLDSTQPNSPYNHFDPSTWAHQYQIGSWKPDLRMGFGGDTYLGINMEMALSSYQDDKTDANKSLSDYAMLGGPYFQFGYSKISFNYINVGPSYYSPLAQTRQDGVTELSDTTNLTSGMTPDFYSAVLRPQQFLSDVPRAGAIYSFYDRTMDNTFPYGLGTPNRQGGGFEIDVKTLEKQALKIKGSAYYVEEMSGNLVVDTAGTGFTGVDNPVTIIGGVAVTQAVPVRNFVYINLGPSFNFGPSMGFDRDFEVGTNIRLEQTNSSVGTLTSTWILGGLRVGALPGWDISAAFSNLTASGSDMGYNGTFFARYPYLFDNTDLGSYSVFTVNNNTNSWRLSSVITINRNSSLFMDYDMSWGSNQFGTAPAISLNNQFMELTYEIKF
jgi:hypothetical protein